MAPNPKEITFIRLLLPLIIGILIGYYLNPTILLTATGTLLSLIPLAILAIFKFKRANRAWYALFTFAFFAFLGMYVMTSHTSAKKINGFSSTTSEQYVISLINPIKKGKYIQSTAQLLYVIDENQIARPSSGHIHLTIIPNEIDNLLPGNLLGFQSKLTDIQGAKNPNAFDFKKFKAKEGIGKSAFLGQEDWVLLAELPKRRLSYYAKKAQQRLTNVLSEYIEDSRAFGVAASIVLGDRSQLEKEVQEAYGAAGALHVLAVSGLHIGIVYLILIFLIGKVLPVKFKWSRLFILLLGIWIFVFLTGASPSVVRAAVMFSLISLGKTLQRYPNTFNVLGIAAFFMLLFNPFLIFNVSFQLSFTAVASIVFFQPKIYKQWIIDNWLGDQIWKLISLGIAAQIGTLPITLYYFHQFPVFFWLSGIIVVPAASIILLLGLLTILSHFIYSGAAIFIGKILSKVIWLVNASMFTLEELPMSTIGGVWISFAIVAMLYSSLFSFIFSYFYKYKSLFYLGLLLVIISFVPGWINQYNSKFQNTLVIYHKPYATVIDHWNANSGVCYTSLENQDKSLKQIANPARSAAHISNSKRWPAEKSMHTTDYSVLSMGKERIVLLRKMPNKKPIIPVVAKVVVLQNSPTAEWKEFSDFFDTQHIVADGSNKPWVTKKWKAINKEGNFDFQFWDTSSQGAFKINLEQTNNNDE